MKKTLFLGLLILGFISCQNKAEKTSTKTVLTGQIQNAPMPFMVLLDNQNKKVSGIKLDSLGRFTDTITVKPAYYKMQIGQQYAQLYLKPGDQLTIKADYKNFDNSLTFSGKGAEANNYLAQKTLLEEKLKHKTSYKYYGKLDEKAFLKLVDSIDKEKTKLVKNLKDDKFKKLEALRNSLDKSILLARYPMVKRFLTQNKDYQTSAGFPKAFKGININDSLISKIPNGTNYINEYIDYQLSGQKTEPDPYERLSYINKHIKNQALKNRLAFNEAQFNLLYTKKLDQFYQLFNQMEKDSVYKAKIKAKYNNIKALQPGVPSPDFTAYDINGKEYHLKDFAGKPLYIDLWATWCGPCRAEIPYLDKIKEQYKDKPVNFVSLDVYDQKPKWEQMVKAQKLSGWQLINTDRNMPFLKKYVVDGIPRFILLDKNGKIIDADAPRPSDKRLISLLDKTINEK